MRLWNWEDCQKWVLEQCVQFQLPEPSSELFFSTKIRKDTAGEAFLALSVDDFCQLLPEGGDTLHAQLQLWKTGKITYNVKKFLNYFSF